MINKTLERCFAVLRYLAIALPAAVLIACGGGGGDDEPSGPRPLVSSGGDVSRYVGTWSSGCGSKWESLASPALVYGRAAFVLTQVQGSSISGTLTNYDHHKSASCDDTPTVTTLPITLKIVDSTTPVSGSDFTGTLDKLTLSSPGLRDGTIYVGFDTGYGSIRVKLSDQIFASDMPYTKQ